ncbi:cellulose synthase/poly-beta-1,6-N-acetylglucosamine synthase-like glycosyltransferase [Flavobacterium sp. 90]|uniref:glycosyltransferase family 2 protein n=1 Tax=unclassified Flavobacterium TaxID=196869 RepID=UPI000EB39E05|nr:MULTISPECIES: glycosyltransferase [unclassified Flavobacterium]RKR08431.1 cellulose synthase/poly-beta-1,6-N-acetylglucosamine synthase-like glycosyltransferase [Flavobacterium sp. 81]TCK52226.1 cellulose synthase/poly-beta-1,6-N-acetylglucosamine synthase-like glycosyltransferase [Flavobacterium sp. 90]
MIHDFLYYLIRVYDIFVACFSIGYISFYIFLSILSYWAIIKHLKYQKYLEEEVLIRSNHILGVSIVAPAFNEGVNIVYNVKSLLSLTYPKFEIIIVNDGSSDNTLEKLITEFDLVKIDFYYQEKIVTQPVRGHYKSTNPVYSRLLIVDKINGKSKADASNAGINSSQYPLFLCTDVDCILKSNTILKLAKPFMENETRVIATGAGIRISNSCDIKEGFLYKVHYPKEWYPRFQELEYVRSFLFGRMAWSQINGLLLVSGGLGMFDKDIVIKAGGYWHQSLGEDMELITRMRKYMHDTKENFLIKYIPESLCWTEVPSTREIFLRQRIRWARGLVQTLYLHRKMFLNPKYGRTAFVVLPFFFSFEFLVPIIEFTGIITLIASFVFGIINFQFLFLISFLVYLFYLSITIISILIDEILYKSYASYKELITLIGMAIIEPFVYHPITIYASLKGYWHFFRKKEQKWGVMVRKGFESPAKK